MRTVDQITYQARTGSSGMIFETATSLREQAVSDLWWERLEPWLRVGKPEGCAYLNFDAEAAFIRWYAEPASHYDWETARVLAGAADLLTGKYALELINPDHPAQSQPESYQPLSTTERGSGRDAMESRARSADVIGQLIPLLAHALRGERRVTMPWTAPLVPEAVMWGLLSILPMIGDTTSVSFLTCVSSTRVDAGPDGLFVSFRPDLAGVVPPDPGFITLAEALTTKFASDPDGLRELLARHGMLEPADRADRIKRLPDLLPAIHGVGAPTARTVPANTGSERHRRASEPATVPAVPPSPAPASSRVPAGARPAEARPAEARPTASGTPARRENSGQTVRCPMCLHEIDNWNSLEIWSWDARAEEYVEKTIPADLNSLQMERALHRASVRCNSAQGEAAIGRHFLPADYGRFGPPVVLGFVGLTQSGKSHLLASMVGEVVERGLAKVGVTDSPLDHSLHRRYLDNWVRPLRQSKVLPGTREGIVEFADAFLVKGNGGAERVVALFDVAGGDLAKLDDTTEFLWIADGLFFVIDSARLDGEWIEDETFSNVLDVVRKRTRSQPVSAAVVLNKADLLRFEEPVDRWLRSADVPEGSELDATEFLRESADVYAFLDRKNARSMAEPFEVCQKATMHVASPTGGVEIGQGGVYPRGVTPRRVLRPLIAMLAMTGVLTGLDAEQVGV